MNASFLPYQDIVSHSVGENDENKFGTISARNPLHLSEFMNKILLLLLLFYFILFYFCIYLSIYFFFLFDCFRTFFRHK